MNTRRLTTISSWGGRADQQSEWRWVVIWSIIIMGITSLPYLYGWWLSSPQMQFSGAIIGVEDANSYLAKMRLGAAGGWLFHLSYTPEPHAGAYLFTFHLLLGKLARLFNWSPVLVYHLARIIFGLGLLFTLYGFISYFLDEVRQRRFAFLLIAAGSGLGWLLILLQLTHSLGLPLDLYVPEAFVFMVLFHLPHLALAESLLLGSILLTLQSWRTGSWRPAIWAGLALLAMTAIAAFYIGVYLAVLGVTWLLLTLLARSLRPTWPLLLKTAGATMLALPLLLYNAYIFITNPILKIWSEQNLILSPEPWHYLLAYGLLIIPAIYGGRLVLTRKSSGEFDRAKSLLLTSWCLVCPILVYLPFNLQRRLVVGGQVPLAILATYGLLALTQKYLRADRQRLGQVGWLLFFSLTNLFLLTGSMASVSARQPPLFRSADQIEAVQWLAGQAHDEVILAVYETGNMLPAYANVCSFAGHGPETVYSDEKREQARLFFSDRVDDAWRRDLLKKFNIQYLYYGPNEKAAGNFAPNQAPYLQPIYHNETTQIFAVIPEK